MDVLLVLVLDFERELGLGAAGQLDPLQGPRDQLASARSLYEALDWEGALSSCQAALLLSEGVAAGRLSLQRFVDACATAPARLFGLYPQKGSIAVGADADLVIYDAEQNMTLGRESLHQNVDYCPYEGWSVRGRWVT